MSGKPDLKTVPDDELLQSLSEILKTSRRAEADLVAHIAEVDARKLYAREAAHSMHAYCTEILHLSEAEAYLRIAAARASRRCPVLLKMLADGRLHLSGIERLAPHLNDENRDVLLKRAAHKSKRQIEVLLAELAPRPAAPAAVRRLPARRGAGLSGGSTVGAVAAPPELRPDGVTPTTPEGDLDGAADTGARSEGTAHSADGLRPDGVRPSSPSLGSRAAIDPVAPARIRVRFDANAALGDKLRRLQALLRSAVPDGDLATIIDLAVTEKLERLEARRFAKTKKPRESLAEADTRPKSRYIPAPVRRAVEKRDGGRCTYRGKHGRRCAKRHDLEFHHRKPFARGGEHSPEVLSLMCRTHNALMAEQDYGKEVMARCRRPASRPAESAI